MYPKAPSLVLFCCLFSFWNSDWRFVSTRKVSKYRYLLTKLTSTEVFVSTFSVSSLTFNNWLIPLQQGLQMFRAWFSPNRTFWFCYSTNSEILGYRTVSWFIVSQWKRPAAHYLTGLSWLRVSVSIQLLCFVGIFSVKTEQAVHTVRFPASHVNGAQVLRVKRMWNALMSLRECIINVWQLTFVR